MIVKVMVLQVVIDMDQEKMRRHSAALPHLRLKKLIRYIPSPSPDREHSWRQENCGPARHWEAGF